MVPYQVKAKVTPGYVAQLELGIRKNPSLDVVRRLARALGVRLAELLG
jgi:transcriptional regulator with XRE-family HTH domain